MSSDPTSSTKHHETLLKAAHSMLEQAPETGRVAYIVVRDRDIWNASGPIQLPEKTKGAHRVRFLVESAPEKRPQIHLPDHDRDNPDKDRDIWNVQVLDPELLPES